MAVWLLETKSNEKQNWGKNRALVVRAGTETEARTVAAEFSAAEGRDMWMDANQSTCAEVPPDGEPFLVLVDFQEG